jgi:Ca2+-binding RTX toxin-like protein
MNFLIIQKAHPSKIAMRNLLPVLLVFVSAFIPVHRVQAASTVAVDGSTLFFTAGNGDANNVTFSLSLGEFMISDSGAPLTAGNGCTQVDTNNVTCLASGVTLLDINLGDQNDSLALNLPLDNASIQGGNGTDALSINGTPAGDEFIMDANQVTRTGGETIPFTGIENLAVEAGDGGDVLIANASPVNTLLKGGAGSDNLTANVKGSGSLELDGENGIDFFTVNFGSWTGTVNINDTGSDVVNLDNLIVNGTDGDDSLTAILNRIQRGFFTAVVYTGVEIVDVRGGLGNDTLNAQLSPLPLILEGGEDDDTLTNSPIGGILNGGAGQDHLIGGEGFDILVGDSGDDLLEGNGGDDQLFDGDGNDILRGGAGNDTLDGGSGNDILDGSSGNDTLIGGPGDDIYLFNNGWGVDSLVELTGEYNDAVDFSAVTTNLTITMSPFSITAAAGSSLTSQGNNIENILGSSQADTFTINATQGDLTLDGKDGSDSTTVLLGNLGGKMTVNGSGTGGSDSLIVQGTAGNDEIGVIPGAITHATEEIHYGQGIETLSVAGGAGNNTFHVTASPGVPYTLDGGEQTNGNILIFDAKGLVVTRTANALILPGRAPVYFMHFEQVIIENGWFSFYLPTVSK